MLKQSNTILPFDKNAVKEIENLGLSLDEPVPDELNPVIKHGDASHESAMAAFMGTILKWDDAYRMWYVGWDDNFKPSVCLATSQNGLNWSKPDLALVEYQGSKNNNIVYGLNGHTDCINIR